MASAAGRPQTAPRAKGKATSPISVDESEDSQSSYKLSDVVHGGGDRTGNQSSEEEVGLFDGPVTVLTLV